jgi:hypothetical protein
VNTIFTQANCRGTVLTTCNNTKKVKSRMRRSHRAQANTENMYCSKPVERATCNAP